MSTVQAARKVVLAKDPSAFQAKVRVCAVLCICVYVLDAALAGTEPQSPSHPAARTQVTVQAGHKKGCRCKRSKCLRRYCECFSGGARCNPDVCGCEGCRNM